MSEKKLSAFFVCAAVLGSACQSAQTVNKNAVSVTESNSASAANIPPEFSGTPSIMTNSAPGINPNAANLAVSNSTKPIPGITDSKNNGKPLPKNTPPIPGIPSEAELKREMNTPITNSKAMEAKPPTGEVNTPVGPMARPRGNRKP